MFKHYTVLTLNEMTQGKYFNITFSLESIHYIGYYYYFPFIYIHIPVNNYQLTKNDFE